MGFSPSRTEKGNPPMTYVIAACEIQNVSVSILPCFGLNEGSCKTAKYMWGKMVQDGHFDRENFDKGASMGSSPGDCNCCLLLRGSKLMESAQLPSLLHGRLLKLNFAKGNPIIGGIPNTMPLLKWLQKTWCSFDRLDLPEYPSKECLEERLLSEQSGTALLYIKCRVIMDGILVK